MYNQENSGRSGKTALPPYKDPLSSRIVVCYATIILVLGIIALIVGIILFITESEINKYAATIFVISGVGAIVSTVPLFILYNISIDLHRLEYNLSVLITKQDNSEKNLNDRLETLQRNSGMQCAYLERILKGRTTQ